MEYIEENAHPDIKFGLHDYKVYFDANVHYPIYGTHIKISTVRYYTPHLTNL